MIELIEATGFQAVPVKGTRGEELARVETPFTFHDGHPIGMYVETIDNQFHLFDDGEVLFVLSTMGFDLSDRRRLKGIRTAIKDFGVALTDEGTLEAWSKTNATALGFARFCSALLAVRDWAREAADIPVDAEWLTEEVGLYLSAWKPTEELRRDVTERGASGQQHRFDFQLDGELIDAIAPVSTSSASVLRKMVDVRARAVEAEPRFVVVVDDRRRPDQARQEAKILETIAATWPLTRLIERTGGAVQIRH